MKTLTASLLLGTLVATMLLGWSIDSLFSVYGSKQETDQVSAMLELGNQIASSLDQIENPSAFAANWPDGDVALTLQDQELFPLPEDMRIAFKNGEALALDSADGISLHYYLARHDHVLSLTPASMVPAQQDRIKLVLTLLFYAGTALLLMLWLYPLIKRLSALRSTAVGFGQGKLGARVNTGGLSYIREIETEFNRMAERIQALVTDNKLLSSAVSHDLRTPLARIRFGLDILQEPSDPVTQEKYLSRLSADIDEMEKLVNSLLSFARLDNVMSNTDKSEVDFQSLVIECSSLHADSGMNIELLATQPAIVQGDADFLAMLVNNLLQNAVQHASQSVLIKLVTTTMATTLSVTDDGPGIPEDQWDNLLLPFHRGTSESVNAVSRKEKGEQTREQSATRGKGHGLGLAIVSRVAAWHGANLQVRRNEKTGHGASISVVFPR